MARNLQPALPSKAELSADQMRSAIKKIDRRIADLEAFDPNEVRDRNEVIIETLEQKLDTLITEIFSPGTIEYDRYHYSVTRLDRAGINMYGTPLGEVIRGLHEGKASSLATLNNIKEIFEEALEDAGEAVSEDKKILRAYQGLDLHTEIDRAASSLYRDGHYSNAIEDAVKALNAFVRLRSGVTDKDGTPLMEFVFSPKNPILKFNSLADESDRNEQKGFMMMMSGAVAGLRNPRAHTIIKDDPERALEFIAYISLLAKLVDQAQKAQP